MNYLLYPIFYAIFFCLYQIMFFTFCVFLYLIMYILNITKAIKKFSVNEITDLSLKLIINELVSQRKSVIIQ